MMLPNTETTETRAVPRRADVWTVGRHSWRHGKTELLIVTWVGPAERFEDGRSFGMGMDDGYSFDVRLRPATAEEFAIAAKAVKLAEARKRLAGLMGEADDCRDDARHRAERAAVLAEIADLEQA